MDKLSVGMVVGVNDTMAESAHGDGAAAVIARILLTVVGVEREGAISLYHFA